jgi:hypothetical protein
LYIRIKFVGRNFKVSIFITVKLQKILCTHDYELYPSVPDFTCLALIIKPTDQTNFSARRHVVILHITKQLPKYFTSLFVRHVVVTEFRKLKT